MCVQALGTATEAFSKKKGTLECNALTSKADASAFDASSAAVDELKTLSDAAKLKMKVMADTCDHARLFCILDPVSHPGPSVR